MNQFFSFKRFSLLVMKHWVEQRKRYGLSVLAIIGLLVAWFTFTIVVEPQSAIPREIQLATFFFSLFLVGTFYASQYFRDLGSKAKGGNFLLVPASVFEKLLCGILFTVVVFFVTFVAAFYLVDFLMVAVAKNFNQAAAVANVSDIFIVRFGADTTINLLLIFFSVQAAFLLGSVYYEKYGFIKTVITGFLTGLLVFFMLYFFLEHLLPDGDYHSGFLTTFRVRKEEGSDWLIETPSWIGHLFRFLLMYATAPFFWLVTYYRLKEKQV